MREKLDRFWFGWFLGGIVALVICLITLGGNRDKHEYPGTLVITQVTDQYALADSASGFVWIMDPEDWEVGDYVSVLFDDNDTPADIRDDKIVSARFSGYTTQETGWVS